jgi:hypothetical protein
MLCHSRNAIALVLLTLPICRAQSALLAAIAEVQPDATATTSVIELKNNGPAVAASFTWLCVSFGGGLSIYSVLPNGGVVPTGATVRITLNAGGTNTPTDLFLPNVPQLSSTAGTAVLYRGFPFGPAAMVDYVSWGGATAQILDAFSVGQWDNIGASAPGSVPVGWSLAYDDTGNAADDWYLDSTPTLGLPNDVADAYLFGTPCPGTAGLPVLRKAAASRPFVGSVFAMDVAPAPASSPIGLGLIGLQLLPFPQDLTLIGMPGCFLYITVDVTVTAPVVAGVARINLPIPSVPSLIGVRLYEQAFFSDTVNPLGVTSNAAEILIGAN